MEVEAEFVQIAFMDNEIEIENKSENKILLPVSHKVLNIIPAYTTEPAIKIKNIYSTWLICKYISFGIVCIIGIMSMTTLYNTFK